MDKSVYQSLAPLWDLSFIFWFVVAFIYGNSPLVTVALFIFFGVSCCALALKGQFKISPMSVIYVALVLVAFVNLKMGYSIYPTNSSAMIKTMLKSLLFMCVAYYYAGMRGTKKFADIFVVSSGIGSVSIFVLNFMSSGSLVIRDQGFFNANGLAVASAFSVCYLIFNGRFKKAGDVISIIWFAMFFLISGTRKALLVIAVSIVVYILVRAPKKLVINLLYLVIIFGIGYLILTKVPFIYDAIGYRFESLLKTVDGGKGDGSAESRQMYIELVMKYYKQRPIWGHGVNTFRTLDGSHGSYSHNNYVELLFSVGIVGTVTYYLIYVWILVTAIAKYVKYHSRNALMAIAFIIAFAVNDIAMVSYYERGMFIILILCYMLTRCEKNDYGENKKSVNESV